MENVVLSNEEYSSLIKENRELKSQLSTLQEQVEAVLSIIEFGKGNTQSDMIMFLNEALSTYKQSKTT